MSKNEEKKTPGAPKGNNNAQRGSEPCSVRFPLRITETMDEALERAVAKAGPGTTKAGLARDLLAQGLGL